MSRLDALERGFAALSAKVDALGEQPAKQSARKARAESDAGAVQAATAEAPVAAQAPQPLPAPIQ